MTDTTTLAVAGLALGGAYLLTREDGSSGTGTSGGSSDGATQSGLSGGTMTRDQADATDDGGDSLNVTDQVSGFEEFDASEHGDLFGVTGLVDEDFGSDGSLSPDADLSGTPFDSAYEAELVDTDTGE